MLQRLHVTGTQLFDEANKPAQLRGISTHGIQWYPEYMNETAIRELHDEWKANALRLALYTWEHEGYCMPGTDQAWEKKLVKDSAHYALDAGLYTIIDWHILRDENPLKFMDEAVKFFEEMTAEFGDEPGILYEICNEPNGPTTWEDIQAYANTVIPVIRKKAPHAVILVGTPVWSQMIDEPGKSPLPYENLMYVVHYYAETHQQELRDRTEQAILDGTPVFVTEFGICDASGDGVVNLEQAAKWLDLLNKYHVSFMEWNFSNCDEAAAMLKADCTKTSGITREDMRESGTWIYDVLHSYDE